MVVAIAAISPFFCDVREQKSLRAQDQKWARFMESSGGTSRMGIEQNSISSPTEDTAACGGGGGGGGDVPNDEAEQQQHPPPKFQRANCATLSERLKRLQPLLDEVRDSRALGFESVESAVLKAEQLLDRFGPNASRIYMVS